MSLPRISIVTPSFNQGQYLEETLKSVLSQGYADLEYIVIDGGSTDTTLDVIKRHEQEGIAYWVSEKDEGQSDAINKGLRRATGEIVTWLNSDDMFMPNALHRAAHYFQESDAALIHGKSELFGNGFDGLVKGADGDDLESRYLAGMPFPQPSSFFRRSVLLEQGYLDETLHYGMDYDLLARIALNYPIRKVEDTFSRYRLHDESKSIAQSIEFTRDWARTFSRVLRSFDFTGDVIKNLSDLGLYIEGEDSYKVTKSFSFEDIRKAFVYFLEFQLYYFYENLDPRKAHELTEFIKRFDPLFYRARGLGKIYWRSRFSSGKVIKLLRNFTR